MGPTLQEKELEISQCWIVSIPVGHRQDHRSSQYISSRRAGSAQNRSAQQSASPRGVPTAGVTRRAGFSGAGTRSHSSPHHVCCLTLFPHHVHMDLQPET